MIWTLLRDEIAGVTRPAIRVPLSSNSRGFCLVCVGVLDRPIWIGSVIVSRNAGWFTVHISDHWRSLFKLAGGFWLLDCSGDTSGIVTLKLSVLISLKHTQWLSISAIWVLVESRISWQDVWIFYLFFISEYPTCLS